MILLLNFDSNSYLPFSYFISNTHINQTNFLQIVFRTGNSISVCVVDIVNKAVMEKIEKIE